MKIYTKIRINLDTLDVVEEESYEYSGPIAKCFGGGSNSDVKWEQSHEQKKVYDKLYPMIKSMGGAAESGAPVFDLGAIPMYGIPSPTTMMPTQQWWDSISPNVKAGMWAPWEEASDALVHKLNRGGVLGNPSAGYSPAAGAALGELANQAAATVGQQAWQMTQPAMAQHYGDVLTRNMTNYQNTVRGYTYPWEVMPSLLGGSYPSPVVQPGGPSMMSNALTGGLLGYGLLGGTALGGPAAAGLGALGGLFK